MSRETKAAATCYHCGEECPDDSYTINEKLFCCSGCRNVYQLLNENQLDEYYCLNKTPGQTIQRNFEEKFRFLDEPELAGQLIHFRNGQQSRVTLYLPQIHCSSCLWLLENLQRLDEGIIYSNVNFTTKEISVAFDHNKITFRSLAELLAAIGYEPHISLSGAEAQKERNYSSKKAAYQLGITGFCFANIMLISFPEYLGMHAATDPKLAQFFRFTNLLLALPVIIWGARDFFTNAWYSFRQGYVNIDAPIALAIAVTFGRSLYEILSQTGGGYLDSMSGIVFFMLLGRTLQNRAYSTLQFNRDYKAYFPVAVTKIKDGEESICSLKDIQKDDVLFIHNGEILPTDALLVRGKARLDYSFVTGESLPEQAAIGDIIYAGARVTGGGIEVSCIKAFSQNSFTRLWNNNAFSKEQKNPKGLVNMISRYFSVIVFAIAATAFIYWFPNHPDKAWNALTAVLIVACPCALLLTSTFTNGYLIDYLSQQGFYIKDAGVIERLSKTDSIVFDKTGTLTSVDTYNLEVVHMNLSAREQDIVFPAIAQSIHPLSKAISRYFGIKPATRYSDFKEYPGKGIEMVYEGTVYRIGSRVFATGEDSILSKGQSEVYITVDGVLKGRFLLKSDIKKEARELVSELEGFHISLLSGDHEGMKEEMKELLGSDSTLHFRQSPQDKLDYITQLQHQGKQVMMIGDGLNDAGALQQSDVGVAVVKNSFSFSPASDVIMTSTRLPYITRYIKVAQMATRIIFIGFIYSIIFNLIGIYFATTARLSPMIAAILMPSSSLGIILIAYAGIRTGCRRILGTGGAEKEKNSPPAFAVN